MTIDVLWLAVGLLLGMAATGWAYAGGMAVLQHKLRLKSEAASSALCCCNTERSKADRAKRELDTLRNEIAEQGDAGEAQSQIT